MGIVSPQLPLSSTVFGAPAVLVRSARFAGDGQGGRGRGITSDGHRGRTHRGGGVAAAKPALSLVISLSAAVSATMGNRAGPVSEGTWHEPPPRRKVSVPGVRHDGRRGQGIPEEGPRCMGRARGAL
jgi:hypothetical protein